MVEFSVAQNSKYSGMLLKVQLFKKKLEKYIEGTDRCDQDFLVPPKWRDILCFAAGSIDERLHEPSDEDDELSSEHLSFGGGLFRSVDERKSTH